MLPDPAKSSALIVGVATYAHMEPLPAVANNVSRMSELLGDPGLWGLPEANRQVVLDPAHQRDVSDPLYSAAEQTEDLLLLYYAGHGFNPKGRGRLMLGLPDASTDRPDRALPFSTIAEILSDVAVARHKVVILDCCFSGAAMNDGYMGVSDLADQAAVDGTYLLASCDHDELSLAPKGATYTAFTGALLTLLNEGIRGGPDILDLDTLYRALRTSLNPVPQARARNEAGKQIRLVRNRRSASAIRNLAARPASDLPAPPPEHADALNGTLVALLHYVSRLRSTGQDEAGDLLIAAAAARWPDQQAAALLQALPAGDVRAMACDAAARRSSAEAAAIVHVLRHLGANEPADMLLTAFAARRTWADVVGLAQHGRDWAPTAVGPLLLPTLSGLKANEATAFLRELCAKGLGEPAQETLRVLCGHSPGEDALKLCDALHASGQLGLAYPMYASLAMTLARCRPAVDVAQLLRAMQSDGHEHDARSLLAALLKDDRPQVQVPWALALRAQGLEWADDIGHKALRCLPAHTVLAIAKTAWQTDASHALPVLLWAAPARTADDIALFVDLLRDYGRPLDVRDLLKHVVRHDPDTAARLLATLGDAVVDDNRYLMSQLLHLPVSPCAVAAVVLRDIGRPWEAIQLQDELRRRPASDVLEAITDVSRVVPIAELQEMGLIAAEHAAQLAPLLIELLQESRLDDARQLLALLSREPTTADLAQTEADAPASLLTQEPAVPTKAIGDLLHATLGTPAGHAALAAALPSVMSSLHAAELLPILYHGNPSDQTLPLDKYDPLTQILASALTVMPAHTFAKVLRQMKNGGTTLSPHRYGRQTKQHYGWVLRFGLIHNPHAADILAAVPNRSASEPLREITRWLPQPEVLDLHSLLQSVGSALLQDVVTGVRGRPDANDIIPILTARAPSPGAAARMRRGWHPAGPVHKKSSRTPYIDRESQDRQRGTLWQQGLTLQPVDLAALLANLVDEDAVWVLKATGDRSEPVEDWFPQTAAELFALHADDTLALACREIGHRLRSWEVAALIDFLNADDLPEIAAQLPAPRPGLRRRRR